MFFSFWMNFEAGIPVEAYVKSMACWFISCFMKFMEKEPKGADKSCRRKLLINAFLPYAFMVMLEEVL